jgi:hypothetical protein
LFGRNHKGEIVFEYEDVGVVSFAREFENREMGISATDDALSGSVDGGEPFIGVYADLFELMFDVVATVGATVEVDVEDGIDHLSNNNTDDGFVFIILIGGYYFDLWLLF